MKFALVEGKRREAQPSLSGKCPVCGDAMIARCGKHKVRHWAHRGTRNCVPWWEPETEWHRAWKNQFPREWQEVPHRSEDGEWHFADVKTESGIVIEFQHSPLRRDERESREIFYQRMVWVVNGLRRVRDRAQFFASLAVVRFKPLTVSLPSNEGALLRDWGASRVPVYFDFGVSEPGDTLRIGPTALSLRFDTPILWRLNPCSPNGRAYLSAVEKTSFLDAHLKGQRLKGIDWSAAAVECARSLLAQQGPQPGGLTGFERFMAMERRTRRRF